MSPAESEARTPTPSFGGYPERWQSSRPDTICPQPSELASERQCLFSEQKMLACKDIFVMPTKCAILVIVHRDDKHCPERIFLYMSS